VRLSLLAALTLPMLVTQADTRVIHSNLNSCVFTIGRWCPVESVFGTIAATALLIALLFFAGFPLRFVLKRYISANLERNIEYRPSNTISFLYRNSGRITIIAIGLTVSIIVSTNGF